MLAADLAIGTAQSEAMYNRAESGRKYLGSAHLSSCYVVKLGTHMP